MSDTAMPQMVVLIAGASSMLALHAGIIDGLAGPSNRRWVVKTTLEALATAENVPLRIISLENGKKLLTAINSRSFDQTEQCAADYLREIAKDPCSGIKQIRKHQESWRSLLRSVEFETHQFSVDSFKSPLLTLLSETTLWRWWDTLWCASRTLSIDRGSRFTSHGGPFEISMAIRECYLPELGAIVQAGPTWIPLPSEANEADQLDRRSKVIRELIYGAGRLHHDSGGMLSLDRLIRHSNQRASVTKNDLSKRLNRVIKSLSVILNSPDLNLYSAPQLSELVTSIHFAVSHAHHAAIPLSRGPHELSMPLATWSNDKPATQLACELERTNSRPTLVLCKHTTTTVADKTAFLEIKGMSERFSRFKDDQASHRNAFILERLLLFRLALQSTLAGWVEDREPDAHLESVLEQFARNICELFSADACAIYRYDSLDDCLERLGKYYARSGTLDGSDQARTIMRDAGQTLSARKRSICYRCVDSGEVQNLSNASPDQMLIVDPNHRPSSIIAAPLLFQGRLWGVIEIKGYDPNQFGESTVRWLEELARVIAPILYDKWSIGHLGAMSRAVLGRGDTSTKYSEIIRRFAKLLMAHSGALYLQHLRRTTEYACVASIGRKFDDQFAGVAGFNSADELSHSARAMRTHEELWSTGALGRAPFDGAWLRKPKIQTLAQAQHTHIAIVPIRFVVGSPSGSITLTSKGPFPFADTWKNHIRFFCHHIGALLEAVNLQAIDENYHVEYRAHALKTRADRVYGGATKLLEVLSPLVEKDEDARRVISFLDGVEILASKHRKPIAQISEDSDKVMGTLRSFFALNPIYPGSKSCVLQIRRALQDLEDHSSDLRVSAAYLAGGPNTEDPFQAAPDRWDGTWADLRGCILASVKPLGTRAGSTWKAPPIESLPWRVYIRMPSAILQEVLNNLVDNAIKYNHLSQDWPIMRPSVDSTNKIARLAIRNLAPDLSEEEVEMIGVKGFRGEYAKQKSADGIGVGLSFCFHQVGRWSLELKYTRTPANNLQNLVWHQFELSATGDRVLRIWDSKRR